MYASNFQLNKVRRCINTQGQWFVFDKKGKNDFGEPNGVAVSTVTFKGIYHENVSYLKKSAADGAVIRSKAAPMILCLREAVDMLDTEYVCSIRGKKYNIGEIKDVSESGIVCEVYLEEVQEGA